MLYWFGFWRKKMSRAEPLLPADNTPFQIPGFLIYI